MNVQFLQMPESMFDWAISQLFSDAFDAIKCNQIEVEAGFSSVLQFR